MAVLSSGGGAVGVMAQPQMVGAAVLKSAAPAQSRVAPRLVLVDLTGPGPSVKMHLVAR